MPKDFRADLDNRPKVVRKIGLFNLHYLRLPPQVSDHEIVVVCMRCPGAVLMPLVSSLETRSVVFRSVLSVIAGVLSLVVPPRVGL